MENWKTACDIADCAHDGGVARRCGWISVAARVGDTAGFGNAAAMTGVEPRSGRQLQRWIAAVALLLCIGNSLADTHVHLDEHEEEVCALCAIAEPGHVPAVVRLHARPSEWRQSNNLPVVEAALNPRSYEVAHPRAPPIS